MIERFLLWMFVIQIIKIMLTTYRDYYYKYYSAKGWTSTHALCLLTAYIIIALPFYFSFAGTNFWTDTHTIQMNVNYNYTGFYAVQVNYLNGANYISDSFANIPGNAMPPVPTARTLDLTVDDRANTTTATLTLTGYTSEVLSVNVILYFDLQVPNMKKVVSQAVQLSVAGNVGSGSVSGVMKAEGNKPIEGMKSVTNANLPLYYPYQTSGFTFSTLITYAGQNSGHLKVVTQSNLITYSPTSARSIVVVLNKMKSTMINYSPTLLQTLKFKYSTYLAFAIISYYIFSTLFKLYIDEGMLESQTTVERIH